jgi:hypothetical protein
MRCFWPPGFTVPLLGLALAVAAGCDKDAPKSDAPEAAAPASTPASAPPEPPRAPDIVVDSSNVSIGQDRVATGEPALADKVAVFVTGRPMIEGQTVSVVVMRNAKPSGPLAVIAALRKAKAAGAILRTDGRDGSTQKLPISFATSAPDCATVAWIAKDAAIDVWPAGGGTAKRIVKGLAGPDMTLGGEAVQKQLSGCSASQIFVGEDEGLTWGLVFDLATNALVAPGCRANAAVLVADAVPGRKLALP